ncbi:DegV family protein [Carboxydochorda subterranea]|uniref:DegV family protein n=1 Tax=Carboxydichorda subterranea TaxID=3109565 RepID=A0ABZ1C0N5_9FIRM|nr:DegV family protein [Limnochorda sp. L945t]WRP18410.1 DegV family protein [Limnochorda sp. L945t]
MAAGARRIRIVTDSMADLPATWVREFDVHVVPLHVLFKGESYRDGIDVSHEAFFEMMRQAGNEELPRTSHPSPADFVAAYQAIAGDASAILSIHASAYISATYQSAMVAAREFREVPVSVWDTRLVSMGEGLAVREVARAVQEGLPAGECLKRGQDLARRMRVRFTVETLEYLWKNGRIGRAQAFVGGLLQLKPVLAFEDGMVTPVERVRGRARSLSRLAEMCAEETGGSGQTLAIVHAAALEEAQALREEILGRCQFDEVVVTTLGATITSHTGPGTIGIIYTLKE